ncbi:MAG: sigma-70 family RNA polymerase sigma factor [Patescibacteria group bacterium]
MNAQGMENEERLRVHASELRSASVGEACQRVGDLVTEIMETYPDLGVVEQYRLIAEGLPGRVDEDLQRKLLKKAQYNDSQAISAVLMLNLTSVFSQVEPFFNGDQERDDELVCAGLLGLLERLPRINSKEQLKIQVHNAAREGIVAFLRKNEGVNSGLTRSGVAGKVQQAADNLLADWPWGASGLRLQELAQDLVNDDSYPKNAPGTKTVYEYLSGRMQEASDVSEASDDVEEVVYGILRDEAVKKQMALLPEPGRQTLEMYFWQDMTLEAIGKHFGLSREGARMRWQSALRKLRYPSKSQSYR